MILCYIVRTLHGKQKIRILTRVPIDTDDKEIRPTHAGPFFWIKILLFLIFFEQFDESSSIFLQAHFLRSLSSHTSQNQRPMSSNTFLLFCYAIIIMQQKCNKKTNAHYLNPPTRPVKII